MPMNGIYNQIANLIAQLDPTPISALRATPEMQERLEILIEKSKNQQISRNEKDELDHFIVLERLVRLAKIRLC
jgi:hypothetical protein